MNYKYLILDFGGVIAYPASGSWDITPKFKELIDTSQLDLERFKSIRKKHGHILSEQITTLEEEYDMFRRFYSSILREYDYSSYDDLIASEIAYNRTYQFDKYKLYDNIEDELEKLHKKYILILLTDNWPCVLPYLQEHGLDKLFAKIYISSFYGVEKKDGTFFDYPIEEYNLSSEKVLFIDDNESNLDIASSKGIDVLHMDRERKLVRSKYRIINDLYSLER